jgi:hypothetical protein
MKAVAAALVLIAGAAVVLWYGNTLNSWVLGGLIGGLAALLLSIPLSLTLFSLFSRHRNEQYQDEEAVFIQEEISLAQHGTYALPRARTMRDFDDSDEDTYEEEYAEEYEEEYAVTYIEEDIPRSRRTRWQDEEEDLEYRLPPSRSLPAPSVSRSSASLRGRGSQPLPASQDEREDLSRQYGQGRKKDTPTHLPSRRPGYGYPVDPMRGNYRSEALRAARKEAVEQAGFDEMDDFSSRSPRRYGARPGRTRPVYDEQEYQPEPSRRAPSSESTPRYPRRPQRVIDSVPVSRSPRSRARLEDEALDLPDRYEDDEREYLDADLAAEDGRKPLVRRAPYTYEDDPARQEMTRQARRPPVRRSSRYLP